MVKIRYADLPGGLHVRAVARGKDTIIYLLPGLTVMQRRDALRRLRSSARVGHGPRLPTAGVASAMMADGIRSTVRNTAAAVRAHPAVFLPQIVIILSAAVAYVLLVSASGRPQPAPTDATALGGAASSTAAPPPGNRPMRPALPVPAATPSPTPRPKPSGSGQHPVGPAPGPTHRPPPSPTPTDSPTPPHSPPTPHPSPTPTRPPAPRPQPTPTPQPPFPTPRPFTRVPSGLAGPALWPGLGGRRWPGPPLGLLAVRRPA
ncbi:MAG TPA: hypothetical protein VHY31_13195 [Streptosporangiaceae bacterium]|nr:hypothetical protein [Streptosporangiaceae bacterium]